MKVIAGRYTVKTLWSVSELGLGLGWGSELGSGLRPSDGMGGVEEFAIVPPACPQEP
jgi:hypothetical protein